MNKDFRLALSSSLLVALGTVACEDEAAVVTAEPHPTIIEVIPEHFLSADHCVDAPGGVRTYVATLFDVMDTDDGDESKHEDEVDDFALPSSDVVPCSRSIAFGWVVPGRSYRTEIQAFDRDDLQVLTPGTPVVVDSSNGQPVEPRWTTRCYPTRAEATLTQRARPCDDLLMGEVGGTTSPTVVEVGIEAALAEVPCGQAEGEIDSFVVRRAGVELGRATCGERVRLETLTPGEFVELEVLAFSAASPETAALGGLCSSSVVAGVTLEANCSPFQAKGAIALDVPALLSLLGARCDANFSSFTFTLDGGADSKSIKASACGGTTSFASLAPGPHTVEATLVLRDGSSQALECTANVEPGLAAAPDCHTL